MMRINKVIKMVVLAATVGIFTIPQTAAAASPITIDGVVYDKNKPVAGITVVAWCGDTNHFGGSDTTDSNGHYLINTNSDDCPLGTELTVIADRHNDGFSDGATHTPTHTLTTVSIHLGDYTRVDIPEYGWISAGAALAGIGIIIFVRRGRFSKQQS